MMPKKASFHRRTKQQIPVASSALILPPAKVKKIPFSRTGNLVFNPVDRSLWGIRHDNGYATLVKIPEPYAEFILCLPPISDGPYYNPSISNDGKRIIILTSTGIRGEQAHIMFEIADLEIGP